MNEQFEPNVVAFYVTGAPMQEPTLQDQQNTVSDKSQCHQGDVAEG